MTTEALAIVNGRRRRESAICVSIDNPSFLSGYGVFETVHVVDGRPLLWLRHRDRARRASAQLGIAWPEAIDRLPSHLPRLGEVNLRGQEGALRVTLTPDHLGPDGPVGSFWLATLREIPTRSLRKRRGVHGATTPAGVERALPKLKTTSYAAPYLPLPPGRNEWILLDRNGGVLEGGSSNLFLETSAGELVTPPVSAGLLPGIVRGWVIEQARALGVPVRERVLRPARLEVAAGTFVTASLTGIAPWKSLDGRPLPGLGPIGKRLRRLYRRSADVL